MHYLFRLFLRCSFLFPVTFLQAQDPVTVPQDSVIVLPDALAVAGDSVGVQTKTGFFRGFFTEKYPNPRKAAFLSLAIPGAGQAYNRRWWKLPIVYATLGGLVWLEVSNVRQYREYRDNYRLLADADPNTNPTDPKYQNVDKTNLKYVRDIYRKYVDQSSLALGLAYLLTATDAFVDANLKTFDTSDDLTLRLRPRAQSSGIGPAFGLALEINLSKQPGRP
ncbi:MAG: DUF5683 domain-containing protein [Saprospiraceae bacterium]